MRRRDAHGQIRVPKMEIKISIRGSIDSKSTTILLLRTSPLPPLPSPLSCIKSINCIHVSLLFVLYLQSSLHSLDTNYKN